MNISARLILTMLTLSVPFIAAAGEPPPHAMDMTASIRIRRWLPRFTMPRPNSGRSMQRSLPLHARPRPASARPDFGAMGVHLVFGSRIAAGTLNATEPEALIYEPFDPTVPFELVGVEFIILASVWPGQNPPGSTATPALDGHSDR